MNNSLYLVQRYARIFVRGHRLFLKALCELCDSEIMSKDKYPNIFSPRMEVLVSVDLFCKTSTRGFENWVISL